MESSPLIGTATYALLFILSTVVAIILVDSRRKGYRNIEANTKKPLLPEAPGPWSWPIIGSLHLLGGYEVPYQAFSDLAKQYGDIVKIDLGSVSCLIVHGLENIREVLYNKGTHFDSRPNFRRYHKLFSGNKENSLAFCNWSDVQKLRREMLKAHTFPRNFSARFHQLDAIVNVEMESLISNIDVYALKQQPIAVKSMILHSVGNVFTAYFCSRKFPLHHKGFEAMLLNFDNVFFEVNQGYAADFLPWLLPFLHGRHLARVGKWCEQIREFMTEEIIGSRFEDWIPAYSTPEDYVDELIDHVKGGKDPVLTWDTAMFALEDIVGGHSAVSNLLLKVLAFIATKPMVQKRVQQEVDAIAGTRPVCLGDRCRMPYTESVILEVIRLVASPIVPHVANQDSSIGGYRVEKDTLIFLNNYELNMSHELWQEPHLFQPERFVLNNHIVKPDYFLPFGGGRRSCMGYKMVQLLSFATLANLLQNYDVLPIKGHDYAVPVGNLALPSETFQFIFHQRKYRNSKPTNTL